MPRQISGFRLIGRSGFVDISSSNAHVESAFMELEKQMSFDEYQSIVADFPELPTIKGHCHHFLSYQDVIFNFETRQKLISKFLSAVYSDASPRGKRRLRFGAVCEKVLGYFNDEFATVTGRRIDANFDFDKVVFRIPDFVVYPDFTFGCSVVFFEDGIPSFWYNQPERPYITGGFSRVSRFDLSSPSIYDLHVSDLNPTNGHGFYLVTAWVYPLLESGSSYVRSNSQDKTAWDIVGCFEC
jgi:hypothetical protein